MKMGNSINSEIHIKTYRQFLINKLNEKLNEQELIWYLEETIDNICDRVRNKMVAPYTALQSIGDKREPRGLVEMGIEDIKWLCHEYLPKILVDIKKKVADNWNINF